MIKPPVIKYNIQPTDCLLEAFQIISTLENSSHEISSIDLRFVEYTSPFFVTPLHSYLLQRPVQGDLLLSETLKDISFPNGMRGDIRPLLLKSKMNEFVGKDFLPIISFPAYEGAEHETSNIVSIVENAIYSQLGTSSNIVKCLRYVIGELVDNITQHSTSKYGYIYSRINRIKGCIEISISDIGIGLLGSYNKISDEDILYDIEAMQAANRGISTKNLPNAENRGFGIITSKKMIIDGLKGLYCMISGNAMLLKTPSFNQYLELAPEIKLNGTIVVFQIPLEAKDFNYINFIE